MKSLYKVIFLILSLLVPNIGLSESKLEHQVKAVSELQIEKYLGKWYEIARIPNKFERNCVGVTAEYSLLSDKKIEVINTCYKNTLNGRKKIAKGIAKIIENGKLKVSFVPIPILSNIASGDYWILYVDEEYKIAVVGEPNRKFGWILSRNPTVNKATLDKALKRFIQNGYDTNQLEYVLQTK